MKTLIFAAALLAASPALAQQADPRIQVIDYDPDLMSLVQRLRAGGHDVRDVWIEFVATDRHKLLL